LTLHESLSSPRRDSSLHLFFGQFRNFVCHELLSI
jgi:hypothetical protein